MSGRLGRVVCTRDIKKRNSSNLSRVVRRGCGMGVDVWTPQQPFVQVQPVPAHVAPPWQEASSGGVSLEPQATPATAQQPYAHTQPPWLQQQAIATAGAVLAPPVTSYAPPHLPALLPAEWPAAPPPPPPPFLPPPPPPPPPQQTYAPAQQHMQHQQHLPNPQDGPVLFLPGVSSGSPASGAHPPFSHLAQLKS